MSSHYLDFSSCRVLANQITYSHCLLLLELYKQVADSNSHKLKLVTSDYNIAAYAR